MANNNLAYKTNGNIENIHVQRDRDNRLPQKFFGIWCILMGIILPLLCDGDASGSLLLIPLGIVLIVEKSKVM